MARSDQGLRHGASLRPSFTQCALATTIYQTLQIELNPCVLLDLLLHQALGERLQEIETEAASLLCAGLCLTPDGGITDGVEEVMPGPCNLANLPSRA